MGAYRKGVALTLGPIIVPVDLTTAVVRHESLHNVCIGPVVGPVHDPAGIRYSKACPVCQNPDETTWKKGRKDGDSYILMEQDEIKDLKAQAIQGTKDTIRIAACPAQDVHNGTQRGRGCYQLAPNKEGFREFYSSVVDTIKRHPEFAFVTMWSPTVNGTNHYELVVQEDNLLMVELVRTEDVKIVPQTLMPVAQANQDAIDKVILPMITAPYVAATYADTFRTELDALAAAKQGQPGATVTTSKPAAAAAVDLTALLAAAVASQEAS